MLETKTIKDGVRLELEDEHEAERKQLVDKIEQLEITQKKAIEDMEIKHDIERRNWAEEIRQLKIDMKTNQQKGMADMEAKLLEKLMGRSNSQPLDGKLLRFFFL